jgi:hypothetical protein
MSALPPLVHFALAAAVLAPSDDSEWTIPAGLHLSSFDTTLSARLDHTGAVDTGAAVLQLVDPDSGAPLPVSDLLYGPEEMAFPDLWATWRVPVEGVEATVRALAGATSRNGDERLRVAVRVELRNETEAPVTTRVAMRLTSGGAAPLRRPLHSVPFQPGTTFARDGSVLVRDGVVVLAWPGSAPEITLHPAPDSPDAAAVTCAWAPRVPARSVYYHDVMLAGPPTTGTRDETALRVALTEVSFNDQQERQFWPSEKRGSVATMGTAFKDLDKTLCGSLHFLRSLGVANTEVKRLTDRPYGYPATDAAVPAEILATFFEFGLAAFARKQLDAELESVQAVGAQLSPARRVALVHALARAVRLGNVAENERRLAAAILALVTEPAQVPAWADPAIVRQDLAEILVRADAGQGAAQAAALPELSWAATADGTVASEMQAMRRALSARDAPAAWDACLQLLSGTNVNGLGSMQAGGDLDGGFAIGVLALVREMLIDDHGQDLHLVPAYGSDLLYPRNPMRFPPLHTRWGVASLKMFRHSYGRLGYTLTMRQAGEPELLFVHPPAGEQVRRVAQTNAGRGRLMPDGSIATVISPLTSGGVNVMLRMEDGSPESAEDEALDAELPEDVEDS